jgi:hypothetical protein
MIPNVTKATITFMSGVSLGQKPIVSFTTSRLRPPEERNKIPFCREKCGSRPQISVLTGTLKSLEGSSPHQGEPSMKKVFIAIILVLGLFVSAHPALANHITAATATVSCTGYTLTVDADLLSVGTAYTIDYTFTLIPASGPAIPVTGTIPFTAEMSTFTDTISVNWPNGPLAASFTVTGTAVLTSNSGVVHHV